MARADRAMTHGSHLRHVGHSAEALGHRGRRGSRSCHVANPCWHGPGRLPRDHSGRRGGGQPMTPLSLSRHAEPDDSNPVPWNVVDCQLQACGPCREQTRSFEVCHRDLPRGHWCQLEIVASREAVTPRIREATTAGGYTVAQALLQTAPAHERAGLPFLQTAGAGRAAPCRRSAGAAVPARLSVESRLRGELHVLGGSGASGSAGFVWDRPVGPNAAAAAAVWHAVVGTDVAPIVIDPSRSATRQPRGGLPGNQTLDLAAAVATMADPCLALDPDVEHCCPNRSS